MQASPLENFYWFLEKRSEMKKMQKTDYRAYISLSLFQKNMAYVLLRYS